MKFTICRSNILASINGTNNHEALFKHQWDEQMKETLWLCKSIANGPFPVMCLWCSSSSALMKDLEHAEPASLPSKNLPAERIEEDPEDNIELHNELGILNTLKARMQALDSPDEDQDDQSPCNAAMAPSLPTVSRHLSMPTVDREKLRAMLLINPTKSTLLLILN